MTDDASKARPRAEPSLPSCVPRAIGIALRPDEDPFAMPPWMPRLGRRRDTLAAEDAELRSALLGLAAYTVMLAVLGVLAGSLVLG